MPSAENAIRFVKERLRSIQCKTLLDKYSKRLTLKMTRRVTVLINSFKRKSGVHVWMPLCKMSQLVLAYNVKSDNKTNKPRAYHALYIGPNDAGTGHSVFKLAITNMLITPRCKPIPIPDDVIKVIN